MTLATLVRSSLSWRTQLGSGAVAGGENTGAEKKARFCSRLRRAFGPMTVMAGIKRNRDESPNSDQNRYPDDGFRKEVPKRARKTTITVQTAPLHPLPPRRLTIAASKIDAIKKRKPSASTTLTALQEPASCEVCSESTCKGPARHWLSPRRVRRSESNHLDVEENDILQKRFVVEKLLGEGTFGKVYGVRDLRRETGHGRELALKITRNTSDAREDFAYESNVLKHLLKVDPRASHLFLKLYSDFIYHDHPCLVVERLGPSLYKFLHMNEFAPIPADQLRHVVNQMCYALAFLHKNKVTHTDLKTDNIVFVHHPTESRNKNGLRYKMDNTCIRLVDFGSAVFEHEHHGTSVTTRQYRAVEIFFKHPWSYPCDVWSAACIIFELYNGKAMFDACDTIIKHLALMEHVLGKIPSFLTLGSQYYSSNGKIHYDKRCSEFHTIKSTCGPLKRNMRVEDEDTKLLFQLLENMLKYDQNKRITLAEALRHDYFKSMKAGLRLLD